MLNEIPGITCPTPGRRVLRLSRRLGRDRRATPAGDRIDTDEQLVTYLLDEARVAAVHGGAFGLEPAFRISYATSEDLLSEACTRIGYACAMLT
jgi:aspartate aminotransferase